jgi:acetolactate synthase-1/2/3 large subunit
VLTVLQEEVPKDTVYTADIGEHLLFALHYLQPSLADQFITSISLGSMGSGIGAAVGAKLAAPERPVISISGDFGFQMYGMELATCVQEHLGVVFLIMNDQRMRMVEAGGDRIYGRFVPLSGPPLDFAALARAHGALGFAVHTVAELRTALRSLTPNKPAVIDVRIDPCSAFPVNARVQEMSNFAAS